MNTTRLSVELAFEDFLRKLSPLRVQLEQEPLPEKVDRARAYQVDSDLLVDALRSGSRPQLEAALYWVGGPK